MGFIRKVRHPELLQGSLRRKGYFAFHVDSKVFRIAIGGNTFTRDGLALHLENEEGYVAGALRFTDVLPFPATLLSPGIMGPFGYVPFMECYHGIVSIRHRIAGTLEVSGQTVDLNGGSGYIEKDWGRAFPSAWIWVQANHFTDGAAFLFSVADIPWPGGSFTGFFTFLHSGGELRRFATYTGACITRLAERDGGIEGAIRDRRGTIEFFARPGASGMLKAPKNGLMDRMIEESLSSTVQVRLMNPGGKHCMKEKAKARVWSNTMQSACC